MRLKIFNILFYTPPNFKFPPRTLPLPLPIQLLPLSLNVILSITKLQRWGCMRKEMVVRFAITRDSLTMVPLSISFCCKSSPSSVLHPFSGFLYQQFYVL